MHLPMLPIVVDLLPAPKQLHQFNGLLEPAHPVSPVGSECGKLRYPVTQPHSENEPSVADVVQRYRLLGDVHRVVVGKQQNAGQKLQALSIGSQSGQRLHRLHPDGGMGYVVLGHINDRKPQRFGATAYLGGFFHLLVHGPVSVFHVIAYIKSYFHGSPPIPRSPVSSSRYDDCA